MRHGNSALRKTTAGERVKSSAADPRAEVHRFIDTIFGEEAGEALVVAIASPEKKRGWPVNWWKRIRDRDWLTRRNLYVNISLHRPLFVFEKDEEGNIIDGGAVTRRPSRLATLFYECRMFMLDDIGSGQGSHIPLDRLPPDAPPSFLVETSPGNHQATWMIRERDARRLLAFQNAMLNAGFAKRERNAKGQAQDPGFKNVNRVVRVPGGLNTKEKYGGNFRVHIVREDRTRKVWTLDELAEAFGITFHVTPERQELPPFRPDDFGDQLLRAAEQAGLDPTPAAHKAEGAYDVICPWTDTHTDKTPKNGSMLFLPGYREEMTGTYYANGHFKCHHGHGDRDHLPAFILRLNEHPDVEPKLNPTRFTPLAGAGDGGNVSRGQNAAEARALLRAVRGAVYEGSEEAEAVLGALNALHAVVEHGSKVRVVSMPDASDAQAPLLPGLLSRHDFCLRYENINVITVTKDAKNNEKKHATPLGNYWLKWSERAAVSRIVFDDPANVEPEAINIYRGPGIEPAAGDWSRLLRHINEIICSDDPEAAEWVLDWCAHMFQKPWQKPGTCLVLRGEEGTGKGIFGRLLADLWGAHGRHLTTAHALVSNFNGHLAGAMFIFADEALFAGDPRIKGSLKGFITEPRVLIEPKGVDAFSMNNPARVLMATNEDWSVPADISARRFTVLDVSSKCAGNTGYFTALRREIADGGAAAFLHDMLRREITGDVSLMFNTEALSEQKVLSLPPVSRWWVDVVRAAREGDKKAERGDPRKMPPVPATFSIGMWPLFIRMSTLHQAFTESNRGGWPVSSQIFGKTLYKLCPSLRQVRPAPIKGNTERPYFTEFPPVKTAMSELAKALRIHEFVLFPNDKSVD